VDERTNNKIAADDYGGKFNFKEAWDNQQQSKTLALDKFRWVRSK